MPGAVQPRDRRLHQGWQFREVYQSGKSFHGSLMTLVCLPRSPDHGRVAFVASRKVGPAVKRNRAKRLLRESFRCVTPALRDRAFWRIWIARSGCAVSTLREVSAEMNALLRREPAA
ncbi:MAG TPA: ribonuclease P protein component [Candidatus Limnocylindrales bacterium]|jgi:ribonuclease P protein component|nr:ribonuclease P protein component [Candidatus Limnocylindrales bacterium]